MHQHGQLCACRADPGMASSGPTREKHVQPATKKRKARTEPVDGAAQPQRKDGRQEQPAAIPVQQIDGEAPDQPELSTHHNGGTVAVADENQQMVLFDEPKATSEDEDQPRPAKRKKAAMKDKAAAKPKQPHKGSAQTVATYAVPADFDKAVLPAVDLSTKKSTLLTLASALCVRFMLHRDQVKPPKTGFLMSWMVRKVIETVRYFLHLPSTLSLIALDAAG